MSRHKQPNSQNCFICGISNPLGLNLAFWQETDRVLTRAILRDEYQSYPGVAHGGIVTAILDETMGRTIIGLRDVFAYTAKLEMKFVKPVPLQTPLVARGWITSERRRLYTAEGELLIEATGEVVASASGTFVRVPDEHAAAMNSDAIQWEVVEDAASHAPPAETA